MLPGRTAARRVFHLFLSVLLLFGGMGVLRAQERGTNEGRISTDIGVTVTSAYFFRGALQEDSGAIVQPSVEVGANLYRSEGRSLDVYAGAWNSVHSEQTGASTTADGPDALYEQDVYAGFSYRFHEYWTVGASYTFYTSPNDAFSTIEELGGSLEFDDSDLLGAYALSPSVSIANEVDNSLTGPDKGTYLELSVSPETVVYDSDDHPVTLGFPATLGYSLSEYYQDASGDDSEFGFAKVGSTLSAPLLSDSSFGTITASAGVHVLFLGDTTEALNGGDGTDVIGNFSLNLSY